MRVVVTLLVRDNDDIVATNIDYYLARGIDHVIITDNDSIDCTRNVVQQYVVRGLATLLDEPADDYDQSAWVTRMARLAASDLAADWVINADVDEFWWPEEGDLKAVLGSVPPVIGAVEATRVNFLPMRAGNAEFWQTMIWREVCGRNALGEPLPGKLAHRAIADVVVHAGSHTVTAPSLGPTAAEPRITVFHFPYRSYGRFRDKIRQGGAALARNKRLPPEVGHVWRRLYELEQRGELQAWYASLPHGDDPDLPARVLRGEAVSDTRLREFLAARQGKPRSG